MIASPRVCGSLAAALPNSAIIEPNRGPEAPPTFITSVTPSDWHSVGNSCSLFSSWAFRSAAKPLDILVTIADGLVELRPQQLVGLDCRSASGDDLVLQRLFR